MSRKIENVGDEMIPLAKSGDQRSAKKEEIKRDKTIMKLKIRKTEHWRVRKDVRVSFVQLSHVER